MKFINGSALVIVLLALLAGSATPVRAADVPATSSIHVQILNYTGSQVWLHLYGPETYTLAVKVGKNTADVLQGKYSYSYQACGTTITGTFNVRKNGDSLPLPKCGETTGRAEMVLIKIQNKTGFQVSITLAAQKTYTYLINMGSNATDQIVPGRYTYSYISCGKTQTGKFNVQKNGATLTLPKCGKDAGSGQVPVTIFNKTGRQITVHFYGDQNYTFIVTGGRQRVYIKPGNYSYAATSWCGSTSGYGAFHKGSKYYAYCN